MSSVDHRPVHPEGTWVDLPSHDYLGGKIIFNPENEIGVKFTGYPTVFFTAHQKRYDRGRRGFMMFTFVDDYLNGWDDPADADVFLAVAEKMVEHHITSPKRQGEMLGGAFSPLMRWFRRALDVLDPSQAVKKAAAAATRRGAHMWVETGFLHQFATDPEKTKMRFAGILVYEGNPGHILYTRNSDSARNEGTLDAVIYSGEAAVDLTFSIWKGWVIEHDTEGGRPDAYRDWAVDFLGERFWESMIFEMNTVQ